MSTIVIPGTPSVVGDGLNTYTKNVTTAGPHTFRCEYTMTPPTGIVVTVSQSGSATFSTTAPTVTVNQLAGQFQYTIMNCAVGDVLSVAYTSANANDSVPNNVGTITAINLGW